MGVFSKVFKSKDGKKNDLRSKDLPQIPQKPTWTDAWLRTTIQPEELHDLLRNCTTELKARGLEVPFLFLPFRPASDLSATRTFIRNYFGANSLQSDPPRGEQLLQELRLTEPLVIAGIMKWCWSRLPGGVVTWEAYELFKIGERDSDFAPDAFTTFIPITIGSGARSKIIFDFFDLLSAIVAHGKVNGFTGRKLSRYAAWWAFEFYDGVSTFDSGYKTWIQAADATSHLFFAYLRSLSPAAAQGKAGILGLPRALQTLLDSTEYPPVMQPALQSRTAKVVITVDTVSPTPFSLLRRAKNFHYREEDTVLRHFSDFDDPVAALTNECRRVLKSISSANDSTTAKHSTSLRDASWSRFEDIGFDSLSGELQDVDQPDETVLPKQAPPQLSLLRSGPTSKNTNMGRPTTPSWADFMSAGFQEQVPNGNPSILLPPDQALPQITSRQEFSPQYKHDDESTLEPGELASISSFDLDDTFWWVWITSLSGEETVQRKATFGRCALVETKFGNQWIVMEEIIKGAAADPIEGAYIAEKKSRFGFSSRKRLTRSKSSAKGILPKPENALAMNQPAPSMGSRTNIAPDQHARIQAAAAALQERNRAHEQEEVPISPRRARHGDDVSVKTNSVLTLQPMIMSEAAPALQWASKHDKNAIRAKYLGDSFAGRGSNVSLLNGSSPGNAAAPSLQATANGTGVAPNQVSELEATSDQAPTKNRSASPEPRNPVAAAPLPDKSLLEVLQNGPTGSKPYTQSTTKTNGSMGKTASPNTTLNMASATPLTPTKRHAIEGPNTTGNTNGSPLTQVRSFTREQGATLSSPAKTENIASTRVDKTSDSKSTQSSGDALTAAPINGAPAPTTVPQSPAAKTGLRPVSPEESRHKLQKKTAEKTGLRGFLGRRKKEEVGKDVSTPKPAASTSAVAAARAALEAKAANSTKAPEPSVMVVSKRVSTLASKAEPEPEAITEPLLDQPNLEREPPAPVAKDIPTNHVNEVSDSTPAHNEVSHDTERSQSIIEEERRAEHEFRSFDHDASETPNASSTQLPTELPQGGEDGSYVDETPPASAVAGDEDFVISTNDRWAQIRKNAAELANRTASAESAKTHDDEFDEEGEESIEARVARIKARVAETHRKYGSYQ